MKKINFITKIGWLALSILFVATITGQAQNYKIDPNLSSIKILGTSNLHDWESKASKITGVFTLTAAKNVQALVINIPVKSIKSGKGAMDNITYETFGADKNPLITFQLTSPATPILYTNGETRVTLVGNLTMAGVARKVTFTAVGKSATKGVYKFTASIPLKMTEFKMKPPTAMFGAMKVGDAVTLKMDITVME